MPASVIAQRSAIGMLLACAAGAGGCLSEVSFALRRGDVRPLVGAPDTEDTRSWLRHAHTQLADLLPPRADDALLTADLVDAGGQPVDVCAHYGLRLDDMDTILGNFSGLVHTVQLSSAADTAPQHPPAWPGFESVWIPIEPQLALNARLGLSRRADGSVATADCVMILPGIFGDHTVLRSRDLAAGLLSRGHHVLALELRACGETERRYPNTYTTWGFLESMDLLEVAAWLQAQPHVRRTGMVGFCWGANIALLAAWADGRSLDDPDVEPALRPFLPPARTEPVFEAGILAFSPVLNFERLADQLKEPRSGWRTPALYGLQSIVRARMQAKGHQPVSGNLRQLIAAEVAAGRVNVDNNVAMGLRYLRLLPYRDHNPGDKLGAASMPVLVVHAINDPLTPAQDVADLVARTSNPNLAAAILPGGGHVGFAAYARAYYFSLIANFFSPDRGPAAHVQDCARPMPEAALKSVPCHD